MIGMTETPLGELIAHRSDFIEIDDFQTYKRCRVHLNGRGVVLRDTIEGSLLKTKSQQVCRENDFLVAEIDAKLGGFGLIPKDLDGAVVSSHYFLFEIDQSRLYTRYLGWYAATSALASQVTARGSTNYAAVRPNHVLSYSIPLPESLDQQKEIVAKIDAVAARLDEANRLRQEIQDDANALLHSVFHRLIQGAEYRPLAEVAPIVRRPVEIVLNGEYPELGVRSFGKGTFHKPVLQGSEVGTKKLYHIHPRDLVFSNVFAWEGAIAVVQQADAGRVGSHRFITCVPKPGTATADFLCFYLLTDDGIEKVREASPGGAGRNRTLGLKKLEQITIPVPPHAKQLEFDALQEKVLGIHQTHAENQNELDAILPAVLDKAFKGEL